jgi:peroxidase
MWIWIYSNCMLMLRFVFGRGPYNWLGYMQFSTAHRLYNHAGIGRPDESLDYRYANFLAKKESRWAFEYVDRDARTPQTFDSVCFKNLQDHTRLLSTDQSLYSDPRTSPIVDESADGPEFFNHQFAVSMTKLGNILVPTVQDGGEIRTRCYSVNSNY